MPDQKSVIVTEPEILLLRIIVSATTVTPASLVSRKLSIPAVQLLLRRYPSLSSILDSLKQKKLLNDVEGDAPAPSTDEVPIRLTDLGWDIVRKHNSLWRKSLIRPGPGAIEPVH